MGLNRALILGAALLAPSLGWSQGMPLGPEFRVNSYTTGGQKRPRAAADAAGHFVVVWEGQNFDIFGQRFGSSGAPLGAEFRVNGADQAAHSEPSVASDAAGNFVAVWVSLAQGGFSEVFGQRFDTTGAPLGTSFRVNTHTFQNFNPSVASDPSGNFVVAWTSNYGIVGQRFAGSGDPLGSEFRVNTYGTGQQDFPQVASDAAGTFVVVWASMGQDGSGYGVFGQRFQASGAPLGSEFRVNTYTTGDQTVGGLARDPSGSFVVVWSSSTQDGSGSGIFGQRFDGSGAPSGPEFQVNSITANDQQGPAVTTDPLGNLVVAWSSRGADGSGDGVFAQRYGSSGAPLGPEFRVNTYTTGYQQAGSVASDAAGNFVVVWQSLDQDGSGYGVYGQRFGAIVPVELIGFGVE